MDIRAAARRPALAGRARAIISGAFAVILLAGAGAMAVSAWGPWQLQNSYIYAPTCSALPDALAGGKCRYTTSALIVAQDIAGSDVSFTVDGAPGRTFTTDFAPSSDQVVTVGSVVPVEFWAGRITAVDGGATVDNPAQEAGPGNVMIIAVIVALIGVAGLAWAAYAWRRPAEDSDHGFAAGSLNPVAASQLFTNQ